jgi:predicted esterase YcpF (UPF0227 family)
MRNQRPRVVYLHGFNSAPASLKARQFLDYCQQHQIDGIVPALSYDPRAAMSAALACVQYPSKARLMIGSSLGGYYATYLAEQLAIPAALINPAVLPHQQIRAEFLGEHQNYYTGERYEFTQEHAQSLRDFAVAQVSQPAQFLLLVQQGDEVLDYRQAVAYYAGSQQVVKAGGSHSFENFADELPRIMAFAGLA